MTSLHKIKRGLEIKENASCSMVTEEQFEDRQEVSPELNAFNPCHFLARPNSFITGFRAGLSKVLLP